MKARSARAASALLFALTLASGGCGAQPGDSCDDARDCGAGLLCDPASHACIDPGIEVMGPGPGEGLYPGTDASSTDAGGPPPGTDAAPTGTDATVPSGGDTGSACTSALDCAPAGPGAMPECLGAADGFPGGYCVNGGCTAGGSDCPGADAVCWSPSAMKVPICFDGCDPANGEADCRAGYYCIDLGGGFGLPGGPFTCMPFCLSDADCGGGYCDPSTGFCI